MPVLLRRIAGEIARPVEVTRPIRVARDRFLTKESDFERYLNIAAVVGGPGAGILILLDADDACPRELGPDILRRAARVRSDRTVEVVLANCEYETWFLAALESVVPAPLERGAPQVPTNVEAIRGAKERLRKYRFYRPTADQARLTARFDMQAARSRAPSFDKMWRAVTGLLQSPDP